MTAPLLAAHDVLVEQTDGGLVAHEPRPGHLTTACGKKAGGYYTQPWHSIQHAGACTRCWPPAADTSRSLTEQVAALVDAISDMAANYDARLETVGDYPELLRPGDDVEVLLGLAAALAAGSLYYNAALVGLPIDKVIANVRRGFGHGLAILDGEGQL